MPAEETLAELAGRAASPLCWTEPEQRYKLKRRHRSYAELPGRKAATNELNRKLARVADIPGNAEAPRPISPDGNRPLSNANTLSIEPAWCTGRLLFGIFRLKREA
jgi:hypothetical protein